jgi:hypothetical protein
MISKEFSAVNRFWLDSRPARKQLSAERVMAGLGQIADVMTGITSVRLKITTSQLVT